MIDALCGPELGPGCQACQSASHGRRKEDDDDRRTLWRGNEKADELAKDGAKVDGGARGSSKALTIGYAAHFHVQVEN